ncbi:Atp-dependent rna helicase deah13-like [Thalictrum thalictroides]|uniref:Atp-dependent rna helicase deah13-like n=1 Tax=Thalictrum thalictroides TaxID=46969 RepID=A0A7J6VZN1_THATH|nr:Atp-dependent rna helicase deah13-like [Thalictrum thalictroides]
MNIRFSSLLVILAKLRLREKHRRAQQFSRVDLVVPQDSQPSKKKQKEGVLCQTESEADESCSELEGSPDNVSGLILEERDLDHMCRSSDVDQVSTCINVPHIECEPDSASSSKDFLCNYFKSKQDDRKNPSLIACNYERRKSTEPKRNWLWQNYSGSSGGYNLMFYFTTKKFLYEAGFSSSKTNLRSGIIGVAVLATAKRVAFELGFCLGKKVGFQVRHDKRIGDNCSIKFMTDGILLRELQSDLKDDELPPIEAILTPLEAELKLSRQEIAKLQDDNKALFYRSNTMFGLSIYMLVLITQNHWSREKCSSFKTNFLLWNELPDMKHN